MQESRLEATSVIIIPVYFLWFAVMIITVDSNFSRLKLEKFKGWEVYIA